MRSECTKNIQPSTQILRFIPILCALLTFPRLIKTMIYYKVNQLHPNQMSRKWWEGTICVTSSATLSVTTQVALAILFCITHVENELCTAVSPDSKFKAVDVIHASRAGRHLCHTHCRGFVTGAPLPAAFYLQWHSPRPAHRFFFCGVGFLIEAARQIHFSKMLCTDHHGSLLVFRGRVMMHQPVCWISAHRHGDSPIGERVWGCFCPTHPTLSPFCCPTVCLSHFFLLFSLFFNILFHLLPLILFPISLSMLPFSSETFF